MGRGCRMESLRAMMTAITVKETIILTLIFSFYHLTSVQSSRYDRSITIFSPDGILEQVGYADKAVQLGSPVVAISNGQDGIALCCEKNSGQKLQNPADFQKIVKIDDHIYMAFAGLRADGRVLAQRLKVECQQYRFSMDQAPPLGYIASKVADIQYSHTRRAGARPFGVSCLLAGFDEDLKPRIFRIDPSGYYAEWRGVAVGKGSDEIELNLVKNEATFPNTKPEDLADYALRSIMAVMDPLSKDACCEIVILRQKPDEKIEICRIEAISNPEQFKDKIEWSPELWQI